METLISYSIPGAILAGGMVLALVSKLMNKSSTGGSCQSKPPSEIITIPVDGNRLVKKISFIGNTNSAYESLLDVGVEIFVISPDGRLAGSDFSNITSIYKSDGEEHITRVLATLDSPRLLSSVDIHMRQGCQSENIRASTFVFKDQNGDVIRSGIVGCEKFEKVLPKQRLIDSD